MFAFPVRTLFQAVRKFIHFPVRIANVYLSDSNFSRFIIQICIRKRYKIPYKSIFSFKIIEFTSNLTQNVNFVSFYNFFRSLIRFESVVFFEISPTHRGIDVSAFVILKNRKSGRIRVVHPFCRVKLHCFIYETSCEHSRRISKVFSAISNSARAKL